jgi:N-acetylglucosamine-6-phosphate deacetylase
MTTTCIKNGRVILEDRIIGGATVTVSGSKITAVGEKLQLKKRLLRPPRFARGPRNDEIITIDARGCFVSPGFIDCHIHGEPEKIFFNEARHGTTAFVIAESCAPLNYIYKRAESIKEFIGVHSFGPNVLGMRLEGPYISKERAGAQDPACIRKPDAKELSGIIERCSPVLKMMTIAPELNGARPLIKLLHRHKIIASIGHSDATYESAIEGIDAGITHSTHTFNAMSGLDPSTKARGRARTHRELDRREPGVVGAVLSDDRVTTEVILDLIHIHRALFELLLKLKKSGNVIVVTDSLAAMEVIHNCNQNIRAKGGAYRFEDGRLAGSSLTMIGALKNAVKSANLSLWEALKTITLNPARLLGIEEEKGSIAAGKDADIVIFDKEFDVKMTMIRGKIAYRKYGF